MLAITHHNDLLIVFLISQVESQIARLVLSLAWHWLNKVSYFPVDTAALR